MKIVFNTGAGISVPSGIPCYRGPNGIYTKNPELEQSLTAEVYAKNPLQVFNAIVNMQELISKTQPNAAHIAIAELEKYHDVTVITQNVDNLHNVAGSTNVIELHGNIFFLKCLDCGQIFQEAPWGSIGCFICEGINLRPNVVLFGEDLPADAFKKAYSAVADADVIVTVGTSGDVTPANTFLDLANDRAYHHKAKFYYINLDKPLMYVPFAQMIFESAEIAVPNLYDALKIFKD